MFTTNYTDPIINLANDPELNKDKFKATKILGVIQSFPLVERRISKLCQLSLSILQVLEKIELNLKNWAFLSLDINSNNHFLLDETSNVKQFNNSISLKVLEDCKDINRNLLHVSSDLDYVTKESKTLTPMEYILDSGTLLTSLSLRNIKLKYEVTDKVTVAYLKAKLIVIGTELEVMLGDDTQVQTILTYKTFVANLLKQLNEAIAEEDNTEKTECLALINDVEKMFEAFKLEHVRTQLQTKAPTKGTKETESPEPFVNIQKVLPPSRPFEDDEFSDSDMSSTMFGSGYNSPLVHSITKDTPKSIDTFLEPSDLHKTTLSEEMPYLLSAFNAAKAVEKDILSFSEPKLKRSSRSSLNPTPKTFIPQEDSVPISHNFHLPNTPLTSQSTILNDLKPSPYSLYNNSLLSRLGIRPQVIEVPKESHFKDKEANKENLPLTHKNLHSHTLHNALNDPE